MAATGFGLTSLCVAARRGWEENAAVRDRVRATLNFALKNAQHNSNAEAFIAFVLAPDGQSILKAAGLEPA